MDQVKKLQRYLKTIEDGTPPKNTLGYSLQQVTRGTNTWFNSTDWPTIPLRRKILYCALSTITASCWFLVLADALSIEFNLENAPEIARKVSMGLGGCLTNSKIITFAFKRQKLTTMLREMNLTMQDLRPYATEEAQEWHRRSYVLSIKLLLVGTALLLFYGFTALAYTVVVGEQYFPLWMPIEKVPYSPLFWAELLVGQISQIAASTIYTSQEAMFLDTMWQLSFGYQTVHDQLSKLGTLGDQADHKLLSWGCSTRIRLEGLVQQLCDVMWLPYTCIWTGMYIIMGLSLVAMVEAGLQGLMFIAPFLTYALSMTVFVASFGQYFEDKANQLNITLYSSDWTNMSLQNQKMMVTQMIVGQRQLILDVPPVAVINLQTLGNVLRRTYSLYAFGRTFMAGD